ncbi:hypothetical protein J4438_02110 [Candidatus Woesearchaeota archaeon]|nr:hypothetical protein [Candidatus Woesearchaeota archaeon]
MNILFVCKYNRFRSRFAETLFKKINKKHKAKSAGIIKGSPIDKTIKTLANEFNVEIKRNPQTIDHKLLKWQDMIVIVADDVPKSIFSNSKKVLVWKIKDVHKPDNKKRRMLVNRIYKRVKRLSGELK